MGSRHNEVSEGPDVTGEFAGQTVLVTGGTTGIGRVVADQLAAGGAHVVISGRDLARGQAARAALTEFGGIAEFVSADLAEVNDVRRLAERALELGEGHVDIVINNAALPASVHRRPRRRRADPAVLRQRARTVSFSPKRWCRI
jgi:NAD(P)-dependent dehydrogenase (short-subunit alcohol dehydrogenase family)